MSTSASSPYPARPAADPSYQALIAELRAAIGPLQALHQQAIEALAPSVLALVRAGSRESALIERTLDQLLDHAGHPEGLALFKTLCRYYWPLDPQATKSYVQAYREMWEGDDENDSEEVAP